jgi:hypothetical protein
MRIGLVTDGLPDLSLDALLRTAAELGIATLEFGCGNWSSAPHLDLDLLLGSARLRDDFLGRIAAHGLAISALNCSGNPLHPGVAGAAHRAVTSKTTVLAGLLGVRRVVMMSGCPGGPGDANANWVTTAWPPEAARVLEWQWSEQVIPYWTGLVRGPGRPGSSGCAWNCTGSRMSIMSPRCSGCDRRLGQWWVPIWTRAICSGWGLTRWRRWRRWGRRFITCMPRIRASTPGRPR